MIRDLASLDQCSDPGAGAEDEVRTKQNINQFIGKPDQDEVYGAGGLVGMSSVDSEQDTITWQVSTCDI